MGIFMGQHLEKFQSKGASFLLRNAEGKDAEKLFAYMEQVDQETTFLAREPGEFAETYALQQEIDLMSQWAESQDTLFLLAENEEGEIVATCGCSRVAKYQRLAHKAELAISVRQDHWRMGLGRKLMATQLEFWKAKGIQRVTLSVDTWNTRAIGLYLAMGFQIEGTLRNEMKLADGSFRDLYFMGKML